MRKLFKKLWNDERGNALIIAGASLPLIMGAAGLASDTIQWALWKRELQRAADSAAIAGVYAKVQGNSYSDAVTADLARNNDVAGITISTSSENSPTTGAYSSDPYAVRVRLSAQYKLSFSSMFMTATPTIKATGTATIVPSGKYCVVSLENTSATGISIGGTANVDLGCGMITNSTSMDAAVAFGSSSVDASPIAAVGGIEASDNWGDDVQLLPFTMAQADPFADVNPPSVPNNCNSQINIGPSTSNGNGNGNNSGNSTTPGCYSNISINGNVTMTPGTYIIDGGDLDIGSQAHVTCDGCVFILTSKTAATNPSSIGTVKINGGAEVDFSAIETGDYAGLIVYQDRRAVYDGSANTTNHINGNSDSSFEGAFYFPSQVTQFNGTAGMSTNCLQLVARRVEFSGTASISNTCPSGGPSQAFEGRTVRLVE
ncbi:MAG TPA: pilus assembly protein TadG-related protein [Sphingomicrobium sp.]|nr:pilus assembly protein TadG-related protein [Sphingomicrobium sp.]